ncbi:hypothetical protein niasHS_005222 [Heterodera schachtii]|uniref:Uncharacterized protein n=1 Tax=Heterodera schachtii TaxID=97005 RepID=A0ABD2JVB1_HETSC
MTWIVEERCSCLRADAVCVRPEEFTKPIECLNVAHLGSFSEHLMAEPCKDNAVNVTDLLLQLDSSNKNINEKGSVSGMLLLFFLFILLTQICIFWVLFFKVSVRGAAHRLRHRRRPRSRQQEMQELPPRGIGHPLAVRCPFRERSPIPAAPISRLVRRVGLEGQVSATGASASRQLETIEEAIEVND